MDTKSSQIEHEIVNERTSFVDDYDHIESSIDYILENLLQQPPENKEEFHEFENLQELFNSAYTLKCDCSVVSCETDSCLHGGNYKICISTEGKELVLNESRHCNDLIYECFENCECLSSCHNRLVQFGPRKNLRIIQVSYNGRPQKGLTTSKSIPKGAFICEYAGEILTKSEAIRRHTINQNTKKMNYIICLNESSTESDHGRLQTFIDPSAKGNIGRYLNHSCDPNCEILSVRVGCPLPKIAIFAKRDIQPNEELRFHYGGERRDCMLSSDNRINCFCGSMNCEMFVPNFDF